MGYEFFYADLQLSITVDANAGNVFADLNDEERLAFQQLVYLAANSFCYARSLFLVRQAKLQAEIDSLKDKGS